MTKTIKVCVEFVFDGDFQDDVEGFAEHVLEEIIGAAHEIGGYIDAEVKVEDDGTEKTADESDKEPGS